MEDRKALHCALTPREENPTDPASPGLFSLHTWRLKCCPPVPSWSGSGPGRAAERGRERRLGWTVLNNAPILHHTQKCQGRIINLLQRLLCGGGMEKRWFIRLGQFLPPIPSTPQSCWHARRPLANPLCLPELGTARDRSCLPFPWPGAALGVPWDCSRAAATALALPGCGKGCNRCPDGTNTQWAAGVGLHTWPQVGWDTAQGTQVTHAAKNSRFHFPFLRVTQKGR